MSELNCKSPRVLLHLGAALAVTASAPLASDVANAATPTEKLQALRAAATEGRLELRYTDANKANATGRVKVAQDTGFNRAPSEEQPPVKDTPPTSPPGE